MTEIELRGILAERILKNEADRESRKRRIESIRPLDGLLASRLARELEAEEVADDQARVTLARVGWQREQ